MRGLFLCFALFLACSWLASGLEYDPDEYRSRSLEGIVPRIPECKLSYRGLPTATIIITAQDEEIAVLEETIRSVLYKSPPSALESIILVDDNSKVRPVPTTLLSKYPGIKYVKNTQTLGVAGSRLAGAALAQGDVLVFLDSNMEVTEKWLEPLLEHVKLNPKTIVTPFIDTVKDSYYYPSHMSLVYFEPTSLTLQRTNPVALAKVSGNVIESPAMQSSAFAISRSWWEIIGKYDVGLKGATGIDSIELAVKSWTCGGSVVEHRCSRVAKVNPKKETVDNSAFATNAVRFAEVWMDEAKAELYNRNNLTSRVFAAQSGLLSRKMLRERLQCRPFSYYVEQVMGSLEAKYFAPEPMRIPLPVQRDDSTPTTPTTPTTETHLEPLPVPVPPFVAVPGHIVNSNPTLNKCGRKFQMTFNYSRGFNGGNCPEIAYGSVKDVSEVNPEADYQTFSRINGIKLLLEITTQPGVPCSYTEQDDLRIDAEGRHADHRNHWPLIQFQYGFPTGLDWRVKGTTRRHVRFTFDDKKQFEGRFPDPHGDEPSHCVGVVYFECNFLLGNPGI